MELPQSEEGDLRDFVPLEASSAMAPLGCTESKPKSENVVQTVLPKSFDKVQEQEAVSMTGDYTLLSFDGVPAAVDADTNFLSTENSVLRAGEVEECEITVASSSWNQSSFRAPLSEHAAVGSSPSILSADGLTHRPRPCDGELATSREYLSMEVEFRSPASAEFQERVPSPSSHFGSRGPHDQDSQQSVEEVETNNTPSSTLFVTRRAQAEVVSSPPAPSSPHIETSSDLEFVKLSCYGSDTVSAMGSRNEGGAVVEETFLACLPSAADDIPKEHPVSKNFVEAEDMTPGPPVSVSFPEAYGAFQRDPVSVSSLEEDDALRGDLVLVSIPATDNAIGGDSGSGSFPEGDDATRGHPVSVGIPAADEAIIGHHVSLSVPTADDAANSIKENISAAERAFGGHSVLVSLPEGDDDSSGGPAVLLSITEADDVNGRQPSLMEADDDETGGRPESVRLPEASDAMVGHSVSVNHSETGDANGVQLVSATLPEGGIAIGFSVSVVAAHDGIDGQPFSSTIEEADDAKGMAAVSVSLPEADDGNGEQDILVGVPEADDAKRDQFVSVSVPETDDKNEEHPVSGSSPVAEDANGGLPDSVNFSEADDPNGEHSVSVSPMEAEEDDVGEHPVSPRPPEPDDAIPMEADDDIGENPVSPSLPEADDANGEPHDANREHSLSVSPMEAEEDDVGEHPVPVNRLEADDANGEHLTPVEADDAVGGHTVSASPPLREDAIVGDPVSVSPLEEADDGIDIPLPEDEANGVQDVSEDLHTEVQDTIDEQHPAKKAKRKGTVYSGPDAVAVVLGQTAELVLVLAGMAQLRAGRTPTPYEKELAATAYQNLGLLVGRVSPNNLVSTESLEKMLHELNSKKVAQKRREEQAWAEALAEADALAKARAEASARAKAEAAAALAQAEADELERRRQVANQAATLNAAAVAAANGPGKVGFSSVPVGEPPSTVQPVCTVSENISPSGVPPAAAHPGPQSQMVSPPLTSVPNVSEVAPVQTPSVKCVSVNGLSHAPTTKPQLGRPPKVRNKLRKDAIAGTVVTSEYLNIAQNPNSELQKTQVTHKQLCLGVQQYIRDHVPQMSQTQQALPPTYISTPFPCQVCKLIAKDTGSVLVCDSCDEVCHVKCVQPPASKGASKGDWNCPKCLLAIRGGKYPAKYGPIRRGSPNSVMLWPPHDKAEGNNGPAVAVANGSVTEQELPMAGRPAGPGGRRVQRKARLEIDTVADHSTDDSSAANVGSSPHLIVHLVNEPSPKMKNPFENISPSPLNADNGRPPPPEQVVSADVLVVKNQKDVGSSVAADNKVDSQQKTGTTTTNQNEELVSIEPVQTCESGLDKREGQPLTEKLVDAVTYSGARVAHVELASTRTSTPSRKKSGADFGKSLQGKQAEVPLPIVMEWVGDSVRRAEGKAFYRACSVGGIMFSVSDCALFRPETPDVPPYIARLQVLWEDIATGHKWVRVSWCYYPTDIPMAMGRPGTTEPDEVYESNHCDNNLVGSIQGPCLVLLPQKYREETEERNAMLRRGDTLDDLPPIFLSRWMYDAPKGVFKSL